MTDSTLALAQSYIQENSGALAAVLPYWPIWAAAQFASTAEDKALLQFVHIHRPDELDYQIEATDGHRAFRYRIPAWVNGMPSLWRIPDEGLLLAAKPLKKAVTTAKMLTVSEDLRASFHGGKKDALAELSSVNLAGTFGVNAASTSCKYHTFPNINQLWPEDFSNQPKAKFAFNARYLKEWFTVVDKLSHNGVTAVRCNAPITPFVFDCSYVPRIGEHLPNPMLQLLLMPVQIRD